MCKIAIFIADTGSHEDDTINHARLKRGDIIDILDDDHAFGRGDIGPHLKIVHLPNINKSEIEHLLGSDPNPSEYSNHYARGRIWNLPGYQALMSVDHATTEQFLNSMTLKPLEYRGKRRGFNRV